MYRSLSPTGVLAWQLGETIASRSDAHIDLVNSAAGPGQKPDQKPGQKPDENSFLLKFLSALRSNFRFATTYDVNISSFAGPWWFLISTDSPSVYSRMFQSPATWATEISDRLEKKIQMPAEILANMLGGRDMPVYLEDLMCHVEQRHEGLCDWTKGLVEKSRADGGKGGNVAKGAEDFGGPSAILSTS